MEHAYQSSTVEMDHGEYDNLKSQLIDTKEEKYSKPEDIREKQKREEKPKPSAKRYTFMKGDQALELDDDFEIELMADKRPVRMTLRELKDRAAGDVAVKNRMHSLAEEKKRVQSTFKQFADLARKDPLGALEFISNKARESDSEFEYKKYIEKLAEQAEKLGQMDEHERKAWELEKKLEKANEDLSHKERQAAVVLRKQEMLSTYPEIGDSEFGQMVDAVLGTDELLQGVETEHDVMDRVEDLIQETLTQRDIISVISDINPDYIRDNGLVFMLSDQLKQNPDLEEDDIRDIVHELIGKKSSRPSQREADIRTLSNKQRQHMPVQKMREQSADPFDLLKQQLLERQDEIRKTPLYKR